MLARSLLRGSLGVGQKADTHGWGWFASITQTDPLGLAFVGWHATYIIFLTLQ